MTQAQAYETVTVPYAIIPEGVWSNVRDFIAAAEPIMERIEAFQAKAWVEWEEQRKRDAGLYFGLSYNMPSANDWWTCTWIDRARELALILPGTESVTFTAEQWLRIEQWRQRAPFEYLSRDIVKLTAKGYGSDWKKA